jgi:type VI secretion system protein ImpF
VAEGPPKDRILPALLDRLTDDGPSESDGRRDRGLSLRDYRRAVLRDLTWLLNANSPPPFERIDQYPLVAKSVLNFGMSELAGLTASALSPEVLEKLVRDAIRTFEPRVNPSSLTVRAIDAADEPTGNVIHLEIKGEIFAEPIPEALYVKTEIDLESGHCRLKEEG